MKNWKPRTFLTRSISLKGYRAPKEIPGPVQAQQRSADVQRTPCWVSTLSSNTCIHPCVCLQTGRASTFSFDGVFFIIYLFRFPPLIFSQKSLTTLSNIWESWVLGKEGSCFLVVCHVATCQMPSSQGVSARLCELTDLFGLDFTHRVRRTAVFERPFRCLKAKYISQQSLKV